MTKIIRITLTVQRKPGIVKLRLVFGLVFSLLLTAASAQHPLIGGYNVYYGSLHNHSNVSDGTGTPATAYNYARNTGHLDFFGLSDHSSNSGSISPEEWTDIRNQADAFNEDGVFTTFYGFEWSSDGTFGHVTVFNTEDLCTTVPPTGTFEGLEVWLASRPDAIAFFNHPGNENGAGLEFNHFATTPSDQFVGIDLFDKGDPFTDYYYNNGYYTGDNNKGYYDEANSRGWKAGASGSDDNHSGTWGTAYPYRLAILSNNLTRTDLLEALRARRFFSTLDKNIALSFKINGMEMGSTIPGNNYTAQIQATDADGEIFNQVILYNQDHNIVNTWSPNTSTVDISLSLNTSDGEYYYVTIREADGNEAISSPVWISGTGLNESPFCSISSPAGGAAFTAPANITISATAVDPDGLVSKVEFFQGMTKLGEDLTSPFSFTWENVPIGTYSLLVKATDDSVAVSTSSEVQVIVGGIPITVTADTLSKVYGTADPALTYHITSGSLVGSDTFTGSVTRDAGENVGNHVIRQGTLALDSKYTLIFITASLSISVRPVSVEADNKSKTYGDSDPALTYEITSGSLAGTDIFTGSLRCDPGENAGNHTIRQGSLSLNSNYVLTFEEANLVITPRPVTVTADNVSKIFGDTDHLSFRITSGSLVGTDAFTGTLNRDEGENVGTYAIRQGLLALGANYTLTYVGANLVITERPITVAADSVSKVYGEADNLNYRVTYGTLVGSDTFSGNITRDSGENAGTYSIRQGTLALNDNYKINFLEAYLTITRRTLEVTAENMTKVYGESDPELTYRITSGILIGTDAFNGYLARDVGENVGSYSINQGSLTLNSNYNLAVHEADLDITVRYITITADSITKIYGESDPPLTYRVTSGNLAENGDNIIGTLIREPGENTGTYAINQGSLSISSNYVLTYNGASLTIESSSIIVSADAVSKIYGDPDPELTYRITSGNVGSGDTLSGDLSRDSGEGVGKYAINLGTLALNNNYTIIYEKADLEINPREITVTANSRQKVHGESDPDLTYSITSGILSGSDTFTGGLTRDPGENAGIYEITRGDLTLGSNYSLIFIAAEFRITSSYEMKVYPNPFTDHLAFEFELNYSSVLSIDLYNLNGVKIATVISGRIEPGSYSIDYAPGAISKGVFIYQVVKDGEIVIKGKVIHE